MRVKIHTARSQSQSSKISCSHSSHDRRRASQLNSYFRPAISETDRQRGLRLYNLTVANVREELGTGSYTTLLPLINAFKTSFKETTEQAAAGTQGLPILAVDLNDQVSKFIQDIWWTATTEANKRIEEISTQFKKELAEMAAQLVVKAEELSQAVTDITRFEKEIDQVRAESEEKTRVLSEKDGEIKLLKSQLKVNPA